MRSRWFLLALLLGLLGGCTGNSALKPDEVLDERTGITWAALHQPIEFVQGAQSAVVSAKQPSFAYLGPVEWNRSGDISYSLWIHVVPGNDRPVGDIRDAGAVAVMLDDGPLVLSATEAAKVGHEPYKRIASWGQTAYFHIDANGLIRLAASHKLILDIRGTDGTAVPFNSSDDTHAVLSEYLRGRNITAD
jgi:hypothetical protein